MICILIKQQSQIKSLLLIVRIKKNYLEITNITDQSPYRETQNADTILKKSCSR
jgi:hypothetical protein